MRQQRLVVLKTEAFIPLGPFVVQRAMSCCGVPSELRNEYKNARVSAGKPVEGWRTFLLPLTDLGKVPFKEGGDVSAALGKSPADPTFFRSACKALASYLLWGPVQGCWHFMTPSKSKAEL